MPETAPGAIRARVKDEAHAVLTTWTPQTDRAAVLWSTCAILLNRVDRFATAPLTAAVLAPSIHGRGVGGGTQRWIYADRAGWRLTDLVPDKEEGAKQRKLVAGGWDEVLAVLGDGHIAPDLLTEGRAALAAEAEIRAYFDWERVSAPPRARWTDDMRAEYEQMCDRRVLVSRWNSDVAASIWDRHRPAVLPRATPSIRGNATPRPLSRRVAKIDEQIALFV